MISRTYTYAILFLLTSFTSTSFMSQSASALYTLKIPSHHPHQVEPLTIEATIELCNQFKVDTLFGNDLLQPLLIERVVGTPGHAKVRNFLIDFFNKQNNNKIQTKHRWHIVQHNFEAVTPFGVKDMKNLIMTTNPNAPRYVYMYVCVYDNMYDCMYMYVCMHYIYSNTYIYIQT